MVSNLLEQICSDFRLLSFYYLPSYYVAAIYLSKAHKKYSSNRAQFPHSQVLRAQIPKKKKKTEWAPYLLLWQDGSFSRNKKYLENVIERKNFRPIISRHIILSSPQNIANYKAPRIAARFCYHYSKTNRNLPSVMQEPITPQHV